MRWIQAFVIVVFVEIGLAVGAGAAADAGREPIDSASADLAYGVDHNGSLGTDAHRETLPSFDLANPSGNVTPSHFVQATSPDARLLPSFSSLDPALPLPIQDRPVATMGRRHRSLSWPATAAGRLAWLGRFLF